MNGTHGTRSLALLTCLVAIGTGGCADLVTVPSWVPFFGETVANTSGIISPAERIEKLQELAENAPRSSPEEKERISTELAGTIRTEEDPMIRAEIIRTLGEYPTGTSQAVLKAALDDPEAEVRLAACQAWARRGGPQSVEVLSGALLGDVDTDVRLMAAWGLGQTRDPAAVPALGNALDDNNPAMQYRAVLSLRKITGKSFDNDVSQWQQYVKGEPPRPAGPISIVERFRRMF